uniref:Eukaryotic translation initiation factor 3 subunit E (Trinotate prediction) n=1 Tax=Henneguya salminicola TaxID=69463 RepID=A0A6G3MGF6_HENSL
MMELYTNDSDDILKFCISNFNLPSNILTITYEYSTILYDTGCYKDCFSVLSLYSCLVDKKTNSYRESLWGQLACSILINDVEQSVELIDIIKNSLDTFSFTKQQQLVNYAYILHWSLFVYFKIPHLIDKFVYMCLHSHCLAAIQMGCPHLIRYLVIAYVMCFEDGDMHKLIEIILQEEYHYSDCFTLFIKSLFCEYDLDSALMHLKNSFDEFKIDYFIREIEEFFSSHAYFLLLKLYAKTHVSVSKSYIMQYFGIDEKLSSFLISKLFGIEEDQTDDIFSTTIASNTSYHQVYIKAKQMLDECLPIDHLSINDS